MTRNKKDRGEIHETETKESIQSLSNNCFFKIGDKVGEPLTKVTKRMGRPN